MSLLYNPIQSQAKSAYEDMQILNNTFTMNKHFIFQKIEEKNIINHFKQEMMRKKLANISHTSTLTPLFVYRDGQCSQYDQQLYINEEDVNQPGNSLFTKIQTFLSNQYSMMIYENKGLMKLDQFLEHSIFAINQNPRQLVKSLQRLIKIFQNLLILIQVLIQSNLLNYLSYDLNIGSFLINPVSLQICLFDFSSFNKNNSFEDPNQLSLNSMIGKLVYSTLTLTMFSTPNKNQKFSLSLFKANVENIVNKVSFYQSLLKLEQSTEKKYNQKIQTSQMIQKLFNISCDTLNQNKPITIESLQNHIQQLKEIQNVINSYTFK